LDDQEAISIHVENKGKKPFTLWLRIPVWARNASLQVLGHRADAPTLLPPRTLWPVLCAPGETKMTLILQMDIYVERRLNGALAVYRGATLFGLPLNTTTSVIDSYYAGNPNAVNVNMQLAPGQKWRQALALPRSLESSDSPIGLTYKRKSPQKSVGPWSIAGIRGEVVVENGIMEVSEAAWLEKPCSTNFYIYNDSCTGIAP